MIECEGQKILLNYSETSKLANCSKLVKTLTEDHEEHVDPDDGVFLIKVAKQSSFSFQEIKDSVDYLRFHGFKAPLETSSQPLLQSHNSFVSFEQQLSLKYPDPSSINRLFHCGQYFQADLLEELALKLLERMVTPRLGDELSLGILMREFGLGEEFDEEEESKLKLKYSWLLDKS
jgi:hypothetical protein